MRPEPVLGGDDLYRTLLELSAEAVWGMIAFATLPVMAAFGAVYAAWQARRLPATAPWDDVDVDTIGGDA